MEKVKKPFYKRWWFIAIVVLFVIGAIGSQSEEKEGVKDEPEKVEVSADIKPDAEKEKAEIAKQEAEEKANEEAEEKAESDEKAEKKAKDAAEKTEKEAKENKLNYSIQEERIDGSIWYVTLATSLTEEKDLRKLVESTSDLAKAKKEKVDSIFVKVNIKDSLAKLYAADGKVALSNKGLAQTGLDKVNVYEFDYKVTEEHLTSKNDLKQSTESYSAKDVLKAFQNADLPTTDSRDNSQNCIDLECTTLITTEDVSIYEWPSVEKAQEVQSKGLGGSFGDAQIGTIIIRMNNKSLDAQQYIDVLSGVVNK